MARRALPPRCPLRALAGLAPALVLVSLAPPARAEGAAAEGAADLDRSPLEILRLATLARGAGEGDRRQPPGERCEPRCVALGALRLEGSARTGRLSFELEGTVLGSQERAVPLLGSATAVRLSLEGRGASRPVVLVEGDVYSALLRPGPFRLRGELLLWRGRELRVPGPVATVEARLDDGRVLEGDLLTGLVDATLHLQQASEEPPPAEAPAVFQISRALRFGEERRFEYRLALASSAALGAVRLPLGLGERVTDVSGARSFRATADELVLATSGASAEIRVRGVLGEARALEADERSDAELWLLEAEPDQRMTVNTEAERLDVADSPIPATLPQARLYLVRPGERIEVSVERLVPAEALSAVVRDHRRHVVLTARGDVVTVDEVAYENRGLSHLPLTPPGTPIYLATDRRAERILADGDGSGAVLVPLRPGRHDLELQSVRREELGALGGLLRLPATATPLTAGSEVVTLGLPPSIVPLALVGGEETALALHGEDLAMALLWSLVAFLALRRSRGWPLAALGAVGLWLLTPFLSFCLLLVVASGFALRLLGRALHGRRLALAAAAVVLAGLGALWLVSRAAIEPFAALDLAAPEQRAAYLRRAGEGFLGRVAASSPSGVGALIEDSSPDLSEPSAEVLARSGEAPPELVASALAAGVLPVPLPPVRYSRELSASRQLVTEERPFEPVLVYLTWWGLAPLLAAWALSILGALALNRRALAEAAARAAARLRSLGRPREVEATEAAAG